MLPITAVKVLFVELVELGSAVKGYFAITTPTPNAVPMTEAASVRSFHLPALENIAPSAAAMEAPIPIHVWPTATDNPLSIEDVARVSLYPRREGDFRKLRDTL